jgi:hypothetical protein
MYSSGCAGNMRLKPNCLGIAVSMPYLFLQIESKMSTYELDGRGWTPSESLYMQLRTAFETIQALNRQLYIFMSLPEREYLHEDLDKSPKIPQSLYDATSDFVTYVLYSGLLLGENPEEMKKYLETDLDVFHRLGKPDGISLQLKLENAQHGKYVPSQAEMTTAVGDYLSYLKTLEI